MAVYKNLLVIGLQLAQSNSQKRLKGYKDQIALNEFFSQKTTSNIFMYLLVPFILQNFLKILSADPEL